MEITKGSKLFLQWAKNMDFHNYLEYGSNNGEIAVSINGYFADHDISNKTSLPGDRCFYTDNINNIDRDFKGIIFTAQYSKEFNNMLIEEFLEYLPIGTKLYVIISNNYSLDTFDTLPWKHEITIEDKEFRVIRFIKDIDENIDRNKYNKKYLLNGLELDSEIKLTQDPSVFSSTGIDKGTRALLEKVQWKNGPVLDIGCGSGVIGIVAQRKTNSSITMVDVNLRALKWANINARENGVFDGVEIISNHGLREIGRKNYYETILSNPPYHTDYSVAKEFIEEGYKMLKMGGTMWFVVKNPTWYEKKFIQVFGGVRVLEHLGYSIVVSEKRHLAKKDKTQKTTKKHKKRMEKVKRKRR